MRKMMSLLTSFFLLLPMLHAGEVQVYEKDSSKREYIRHLLIDNGRAVRTDYCFVSFAKDEAPDCVPVGLEDSYSLEHYSKMMKRKSCSTIENIKNDSSGMGFMIGAIAGVVISGIGSFIYDKKNRDKKKKLNPRGPIYGGGMLGALVGGAIGYLTGQSDYETKKAECEDSTILPKTLVEKEGLHIVYIDGDLSHLRALLERDLARSFE